MQDQQMALAGLATIALIYVMGILVLGWMGRMAFAKTATGGTKSFGLLLARAVPFLTIALVLLAAAVLAILDKLTDGSVSILSGVAGYVLGRGLNGLRGDSPKK